MNNFNTSGGGRVIVVADSITMKGSSFINANGVNLHETPGAQNGGTGGYVYLYTENAFLNNTYDTTCQINAEGAGGVPSTSGSTAGYGGSGGVVILEHFNMPAN